MEKKNTDLSQIFVSVGEMKEKLKVIFKGNKTLVPFMWGPPGIGKSAIVRQVAKELGVQLIDTRLSQLNPVDMKGVPIPITMGTGDRATKITTWALPEFINELQKHKEGIWFVDELNTAHPDVQKSFYEYLYDRKNVPDDWLIVCAGNRQSDRSNVYRLPSALANRVIHYEIRHNFEDFKRWALENGIVKEVIGYLSFQPQDLFNFNPDFCERGFATPRSWERVSDLIKCGLCGVEDIAAAVGPGIATKFMGFLECYGKIPDIEEILRTGKTTIALTKEEPQLIYATISALLEKVQNLKSKLSSPIVENVLRFSVALPKEYAVALLHDLAQIPEFILIFLQKSKDFEKILEGFAKYINIFKKE